MPYKNALALKKKKTSYVALKHKLYAPPSLSLYISTSINLENDQPNSGPPVY